MPQKTSRLVRIADQKKSQTRKAKKSSGTEKTGSTVQSTKTSQRKIVSVENFVRCIRTLHDLGLAVPFVRSAKSAKMTLTMDTATFERVKKSVNKKNRRPPALSDNAGSPAVAGGPATASFTPPMSGDFDFGSQAPGGLRGIRPLTDPFDF